MLIQLKHGNGAESSCDTILEADFTLAQVGTAHATEGAVVTSHSCVSPLSSGKFHEMYVCQVQEVLKLDWVPVQVAFCRVFIIRLPSYRGFMRKLDALRRASRHDWRLATRRETAMLLW